MKWFLLIILLLNFNQSYPADVTRFSHTVRIVEIDTLNSVLDYIREHEGLRLKPYKCVAGYSTIGYGHVIKDNESYLFSGISNDKANELLREDFNQSMDFVDRYNYSGNARWAYAHFVFATGCGNFQRGKFRLYSDTKRDSELLKWCHYYKDGERMRSEYIYNIRKTEVDMLNDRFVYNRRRTYKITVQI